VVKTKERRKEGERGKDIRRKNNRGKESSKRIEYFG